MRHFCFYELFSYELFFEILLNSSLFRVLYLLRFSSNVFFAISRNITHALYEQKRPCKVGFNVYVRKNPMKAKSRVYEVGVPVRLRIRE